MKKFATLIIRLRTWVIVFTLALTAVFGYFLKDLKINPDIVSYLPADDSIVTRFNYIGRQYSSSAMGIIILESDDVFSKESIEHIQGITDALRNTEGVDYVTSLTNVMDIRTTADSSIEISRLIDEYALPQTAEELSKIRDYTLSKEMYVGRLVSADARYATVICRINQDFDKNQVAERIKDTVSSLNFSEKVYFEGMPFQLLSIFDYILKDLLLLIPMIILLIAIALFISFRSLRGVVLPIVSVGIGIIWTMGLMAMSGVALTPISDAIPVVLFAVGVAYSIHVINKFNSRVTDAGRRKEQSAEALGEVGLPVVLAGVTTFMGFLSFIFGAYLVIIRDFGIFSSLGVLFILWISITFTPAMLSFMKPARKKAEKGSAPKRQLLARLLESFATLATRRRKTVLWISLAILVAGIVGIPFIKNKIDLVNYFNEKTDIRKSAALMNQEFGGSVPIQILVRGDIQDPIVMNEIRKLQDFLAQQPHVSNVQSIADFIEELNQAMGEGKQVPDSRDKISNLWFLIDGDEIINQLVNPDKTEAVVMAYMKNVDTKDYHRIDQAIDDYIAGVKTPGVTIAKTGMPSVYSNLDRSLIFNLIQSVVISLLLIFICMALLVRSVKGALLGIVPLVFSVIFVFGFMGISGIALDIATVLIASITVGAGIDYSIHFVTAYRGFTGQGLDVDESIRRTLTSTGRGIVINVATVILGFLVLIFAHLVPLRQFGVLIAVTMFVSGFAAITLLPALLSLFKMKLQSRKSKIQKN